MKQSAWKTSVAGGLGALLVLMSVGPSFAADAGWKPTSAVEFVVGVGAGGGTDVYARQIQKIIQDERLAPVPLNVINKPGGGGALGLNYLAQRPADGHTIAIGNATLLSSHIVGRNPLTYTDVKPLAFLAQEYVAFAVKADSPLKTGKDLVDRLRKDPASVSIAIGAAVGNQNHIAVALAARSGGVDPRKLKTVIFKSSGETMSSILGGHVDVGMSSTAGFVRHMQAGTMRLIAIAAPQRLEGALAGIPTWKELGVDSVAGNWYVVYGPRGMEGAQAAYWERVLADMVKTPEWKTFADAKQVTAPFLGSAGTEKFLKAEYEKLKSVLAELGLAR